MLYISLMLYTITVISVFLFNTIFSSTNFSMASILITITSLRRSIESDDLSYCVLEYCKLIL